MWLKRIFVISIAFLATLLFADLSFAKNNYQVHGRFGLLSANYSGVAALSSGSFTIPNTIDIELELHQTSQRSLSFRSTIGMDLLTSAMRYNYAGVGSRHYFWSKGSSSLTRSFGSSISIVPKSRHYLGFDLGIAQLQLSNADVLNTYSSTFEFGLTYGFIYQLNRDLGLQFQTGGGFGYGFSSVTVTAITIRMLFGLAYYF